MNKSKHYLILEDQPLLIEGILRNKVKIFGREAVIESYLDFESMILTQSKENTQFDLAIIDPGISGQTNNKTTRCRVIRSILNTVKTERLAVLTGSFDEEEGKEMLALGVDYYLSKSGMSSDLLKKIVSDDFDADQIFPDLFLEKSYLSASFLPNGLDNAFEAASLAEKRLEGAALLGIEPEAYFQRLTRARRIVKEKGYGYLLEKLKKR